jgi:ribonuclease D
VVLRELAAWREEEAQRRNKPRASILGDEILVDLSRRAPTDGETLRNFRGQFARAVGRYEREILAAVQRALATPRDAWPAPPAHQSGPQPGSGVLELMQAALRLCADAAQIAPTMVATNADLHALVESHLAGEAVDLPVLRGWRNQIAGQRLLALLRGEIALRVDARKQRAVIEE